GKAVPLGAIAAPVRHRELRSVARRVRLPGDCTTVGRDPDGVVPRLTQHQRRPVLRGCRGHVREETEERQQHERRRVTEEHGGLGRSGRPSLWTYQRRDERVATRDHGRLPIKRSPGSKARSVPNHEFTAAVDPLPLSLGGSEPSPSLVSGCAQRGETNWDFSRPSRATTARSEEHTSELQSPDHLVCLLLLEKKKELT